MSVSDIRLVSLITLCVLTAQHGVLAQPNDSTKTRLRPLGTPSAADAYQGSAQTVSLLPAPRSQAQVQGQANVQALNPSPQVSPNGYASPGVRQTVMQQPFTAPQLPPTTSPGGFAPPPTTSPALPVAPVPTPAAPPRSLPSNPGVSGANSNLIPVPQEQSILAPGSDLTPIAQPELSNGFATIDNCNCVSAPSDHNTASMIPGCAPVSYQTPAYQATTSCQAPAYTTTQTYAVVPTATSTAAVLPNGLAPPQGSAAPAGNLVTFGQEVYPVQVGQGVWGQPVAYVPGQPVRNWFRYIFP